MRWLFWILGLFALAVALALALRFNAGYVLLVSPPYRVELSLNLFIFGSLLAIGLGYLLLRLVLGALELPARVREYRARRQRDNARGRCSQGNCNAPIVDGLDRGCTRVQRRRRDERDSNRSAAPLRKAEDARLLDTTEMDIDTAFREALGLIEAELSRKG